MFGKNSLEFYWFLVIIFLAILVRLIFAFSPGFSFDLIYNQQLGDLVLKEGVVVASAEKYSLPPVMLYLLGFNAFLNQQFGGEGLSQPIYNFISRLFPFLADSILGILLFLILFKKTSQFNFSLLVLVFYLFNPGVVYNSAVWGQTDTIYTLFIFLAIILLIKNRKITHFVLSFFFFSLAIFTKPQSIIFLPLIFFIIFKQKKLKTILESFLIFGGVFLLIFIFLHLPFIFKNQLSLLFHHYLAYFGKFPYITVNAFNFWWLLSPLNISVNFWNNFSDNFLVFGLISLKSLGIILMLLFYFFLFYNLKKKVNFSTVIYSAFLISFAFFLFPTEIHERYLFSVFIFLALLLWHFKNLIWTYIILALTYFFNLFWVFNSYFDPQDKILLLFNQLTFQGKLFALINLLVFLYCFYYFIFKVIKEKTNDFSTFKK